MGERRDSAESLGVMQSIPIVFSPIKINDVNYVDGGVLRNLPAWSSEIIAPPSSGATAAR